MERRPQGVDVFERGKVYHRRADIHARYGGNGQSGIAPCANYPLVLLFTGPAGENHGYRDGWTSETDFLYSGEGQLGDMEMARGNRSIRNHEVDGRELHLFEKTDRRGYYRYLGRFRYVSHEIRRGQDTEGNDRSQIMFTLKLTEE